MDQDRLSSDMSGTFHGPAMQAGIVHGGMHVHVSSASALPAPVPPPESWAETGSLPPEIKSLLEAQIQAAQEMPYRLPGARRPSLDTVYVRQNLGTHTEEPAEQPRPTPILDSRGQLMDPPSTPVVRLAVRPPARTVRKALDDNTHAFVTGGPGQGKSTLSLRLAAGAAMEWASPTDDPPITEPVVPLRLTARELARRLNLPFPQALAESVQAEYRALLGASVDPLAFGQRIVGCRWLLLVDGLDEVADSIERDWLVKILARWASEPDSPYRVVLTTRPIEGAALAPLQRIGAASYELQPFDEEALKRFAANWFKDSSQHADRFVRQIRAAHLDELVRVPLLATIAAIIFEQHKDRPLPDNQYELYETYLKYLRTAHPTDPSPLDDICTPLLEHLGCVRLDVDTSLVTAAREWVGTHFSQAIEAEDMTAYLVASGLLNRRGDDLRFIHHSFAEHLAATAKARELPVEFDPEDTEFARLLHSARPSDRGRHARAVLLHYTRLRTTEADRIIESLHRGSAEDQLIAARLLAGHVPASPVVVDAFLSTARDWAMSNQYPGQAILGQVSRATHHPGIATWLVALMHDGSAPWNSRISAATALATRLRGKEAPAAILQLRQVIDDDAILLNCRLNAAEALSDCGGEREAAERGLRAVLADPSATASVCRSAALILANFDGPARDRAVEALQAWLEDPWTPEAGLVEAATGLVEIGVEFHERCAGVFRTVLRSRPGSVAARDAATGLASLGVNETSEAVTALTEAVTDRRLSRSDRKECARELAKLGPQHRLTAAQYLVELSEEFNVQPVDLRTIAVALSEVGLTDRSLLLLRSVLSRLDSSAADRLGAAQALIDLGPGFVEEAAETLQRLADGPMSDHGKRASALAGLAALGEPFRARALATLRALLASRGSDLALRCRVAAQLIKLGTEFHADVARNMLDVAGKQLDPSIRTQAWRVLRNLGTQFRERAELELLALGNPVEVPSWELYEDFWYVNLADVDDRELLARKQIAVVSDAGRAPAQRCFTARMMLFLGKRWHPQVLDAVVELLKPRDLTAKDFPTVASGLEGFGPRARATIADALRALCPWPGTTPETVRALAEALENLGFRHDSGVVSMLRAVVADELVAGDQRATAAVALARAAPEELPIAVHLVLQAHEQATYFLWEDCVRDVAELGGDVVERLRELSSGRDVAQSVREAASGVTVELDPASGDTALAELRSQAGDEFLDCLWRLDLFLRLAKLDEGSRDDAVRYHCSILNDERQMVRDRATAAGQLVQLDESCAALALAELRRFASSQELTVAERSWALRSLSDVLPWSDPEVGGLALAVAHDPEASADARRRVNNRLAGPVRTVMKRLMLADYTASVKDRALWCTRWESSITIARDSEAMIRSILTAPETSFSERVEAAAALAQLSPACVPEAERLLRSLGMQHATVRDALAKLTSRLCHEVAEYETGIFLDERRSSWHRATVGCVLVNRYSSPPDGVIASMRGLLDDQRLSDRSKIGVRYALRRQDGLDALRAVRDDGKSAPNNRRLVASWLWDRGTADRVAAVKVLHALAIDTDCRPMLRWRAADNLMWLGERGRDLATAVLQEMVADESLPVIVRVDSVRVLMTNRPDLRVGLLRLLRRLAAVANPLARIQVLDAIGLAAATEATTNLFDMAFDRTSGPGVRLRAASIMGELDRSYHEKMAIVAREIAHDETVPIHIRVKAARALARWSELCRPEARALLVELTSQWPRSGPGRDPE